MASSFDAARFSALLKKFSSPAPVLSASQEQRACPQKQPAVAEEDDDEVCLGTLRAALPLASAPVLRPLKQEPFTCCSTSATSPCTEPSNKRQGRLRRAASVEKARQPQVAEAAEAVQCVGQECGEKSKEEGEEVKKEEEKEEEEKEEGEEDLVCVNIRELARSVKKSARKAARKGPAGGGGGGGAGCCSAEYDYEDGWLVGDDVCEYEEDAEGSLNFDEGDIEEEEEEEEAESEESEEEGSSDEELENCGREDSQQVLAAPCLQLPSQLPLPAPQPGGCRAVPAPREACQPKASFAGLKDGAPHPSTGLALIREELGLAAAASAAAQAPTRHAFRNRAHRDALTRTLYAEYNARVFSGRLPPLLAALGSSSSSADAAAFHAGAGVPVEWRGRLTRTAGLTFSSQRPSAAGPCYCARIALSVTVLDSPLKLAQTLLHEMCHVAVWLLCHVQRPPHGAAFQSWARLASSVYPLRAVTVCHNYKIETKYMYACGGCGLRVGRHSKSIASGVEACRACRVGVMVLLQASTASSATPSAALPPPSAPRTVSRYQAFIAAERARVAVEVPGLGPRETMAELGKRWGRHKREMEGGLAGLAERLSSVVIEVD